MAEWKILEQSGVSYVAAVLDNETVRAESGAMRYMRGDIEMESKAPSVGGFLKAAVTGESFFKPTYTGSGLLVLEPSLGNYFRIDLDNEEMILDQGAYWASDGAIEISAKRNKAISGMFSGEGWFQTSAKGTGAVIVASEGPVEVLDLQNEKLVVDGSFAVARSAGLNFSVKKSSKSLIGSVTSGEGLVNVIEGTGRVYLAPIPNRNMVLAGMMHNIGMPKPQQKSGALNKVLDIFS